MAWRWWLSKNFALDMMNMSTFCWSIFDVLISVSYFSGISGLPRLFERLLDSAVDNSFTNVYFY
jgi:hypothetical protein